MHMVAIAPATQTVPLGRGAVVVTGISLRKLTGLIVAYPDLVNLMVGGKIDAGHLLAHAPNAALGMFHLGLVGLARPAWWKPSTWFMTDNGSIERAFDVAGAGQQIGAIAAIVDLTFEGGDRAIPFLKQIVAPAPALAPEKGDPTPPAEATIFDASTQASSSG